MKTKRHRAFLATLTAAALLFVAAGEAPDNSLVISSIESQGPNLVLTGIMPAGLASVALETRPSLEDPWTQVIVTNAPSAGGPITFVVPRIGDKGFMRLTGSAAVASTQPTPVTAISTTLGLATVSLVKSNAITANTAAVSDPVAILHFKGVIDGADKISIHRNGALWEHAKYQWPDTVEVNGVTWRPSEKNYLTAPGDAPLLPEGYTFDNADLQVISGRDIVALEKSSDGVVVYIYDTPWGADTYEFNVLFHLKTVATSNAHPGARAALHIDANIDGSDTLVITSGAATWKHHSWSPASGVKINGVPWDTSSQTVLTNSGPTRFLRDGVNFATAHVMARKGRDLVTLQATDSAIIVNFADAPDGAAHYEMDIGFGN